MTSERQSKIDRALENLKSQCEGLAKTTAKYHEHCNDATHKANADQICWFIANNIGE